MEQGTNMLMPGVHMVLERLPDGVDIGQVRSDENGIFEMTVRGGARYGLLAKHPGYISTNENFDLNKLASNDSIVVDIYLSQIKRERASCLRTFSSTLTRLYLKLHLILS